MYTRYYNCFKFFRSGAIFGILIMQSYFVRGTSPTTIVLSKGKGTPKPRSMAHGFYPNNKHKPAPEAIARGFTLMTSSESKVGRTVSCGPPPAPPRCETNNPNWQRLPILTTQPNKSTNLVAYALVIPLSSLVHLTSTGRQPP